MPATYSLDIQTARMTATRDACVNGTLEILDGDTVLVAHGLSAGGGTVADGVWTLELTAARAAATGTGTASAAQIRTAGGEVKVRGLTLGDSDSAAEVKLQNTSIRAGQPVEFTAPPTLSHGEA